MTDEADLRGANRTRRIQGALENDGEVSQDAKTAGIYGMTLCKTEKF